MAIKVNGRATHTLEKSAGSSNPQPGIFSTSSISTYKHNTGDSERWIGGQTERTFSSSRYLGHLLFLSPCKSGPLSVWFKLPKFLSLLE